MAHNPIIKRKQLLPSQEPFRRDYPKYLFVVFAILGIIFVTCCDFYFMYDRSHECLNFYKNVSFWRNRQSFELISNFCSHEMCSFHDLISCEGANGAIIKEHQILLPIDIFSKRVANVIEYVILYFTFFV